MLTLIAFTWLPLAATLVWGLNLHEPLLGKRRADLPAANAIETLRKRQEQPDGDWRIEVLLPSAATQPDLVSLTTASTTAASTAATGASLPIGNGNGLIALTLQTAVVESTAGTSVYYTVGLAPSISYSVLPTSTSSTSSGPQPTQSLDSTAQTWLDLHNAARAEYGAGNLTWNANLLPTAQANAVLCHMQHTNAGENIAGASGGLTPAESVQMWMNEASLYDWSNPGYTDASGHFTQVVWKGSSELGCYIAECAAGTMFDASFGTSYQATCEYSPVGNVVNAGEFAANVGSKVS